DTMRPMLATAGAVPTGPGWAFEFRWEGLRSIAHIGPDGLRLLNGNDRNVAPSYPELAVLVERAGDGGLLLDGKIVALDGHGRPSLEPLRRRMNVRRPSPGLQRRAPVAYYVTDVLYADGRPTLALPYRERRELLDELGLAGGPVVVSPSFTEADGQVVVNTAVEYGLDGVIAKRLDSPYRPGRRSRAWVETVLRPTVEVVIGGWTPREDTVGALLVGMFGEGGGLRYVGRVATGMTPAERRDLEGRLEGLASAACPFAQPPPQSAGARWVRPQLVGEVGYRRWTGQSMLAHPSWHRLSPDADPAAVRDPIPPDVAVTPDAPLAAPSSGEVAEAQLRALRAQISPHFVYNALNTIRALVRTDPGHASDLLVDFADFGRHAFRPGVEVTRLADELAAIEQYLRLEQARFGSRLRVELRAEPAVADVELPFLAVQAVVEHAVRDGIEATAEGGGLTVTATAAGAGCLVVVRTHGGDPDWPGRAVVDLTTRLSASFGNDFEVSVRGHGASEVAVAIRVPIAVNA
ncbi:MAG: hypothetical protein JWR88_2264, partial [Pseudonocardia sp.]|nr:hypothetical protein [Pseudonocardia sp.]